MGRAEKRDRETVGVGTLKLESGGIPSMSLLKTKRPCQPLGFSLLCYLSFIPYLWLLGLEAGFRGEKILQIGWHASLERERGALEFE